MPQRQDAAIEVVGFEWVPLFARGQVRDLRVRWALEEIGLPYRTRLISAIDRPAAYFAEQPFGQVPAYHEGDFHLFECGAIALHIAEKDERLLPGEPVARARAISWLFAALNSIDPHVMQIATIDLFCAGEEWAKLRRAGAVETMERRLRQLADALGERDWLEDRFTVGDLMMVATLRNLRPGQVSMPERIAAYIARGEARPAFQAALAAQLADFIPDPEGVPA